MKVTLIITIRGGVQSMLCVLYGLCLSPGSVFSVVTDEKPTCAACRISSFILTGCMCWSQCASDHSEPSVPQCSAVRRSVDVIVITGIPVSAVRMCMLLPNTDGQNDTLFIHK